MKILFRFTNLSLHVFNISKFSSVKVCQSGRQHLTGNQSMYIHMQTTFSPTSMHTSSYRLLQNIGYRTVMTLWLITNMIYQCSKDMQGRMQLT